MSISSLRRGRRPSSNAGRRMARRVGSNGPAHRRTMSLQSVDPRGRSGRFMRSKEPNPYLFKIERKKRAVPTLAHDIGKGSPCTKCDEKKCPGLELHYWKDVCLNCGCHLNDHLAALKGMGGTDSSTSGEIGKLVDRPDRVSTSSNAPSSIGHQSGMTKYDEQDETEDIVIEPGRTLNLARKFQDWMLQSGPGGSYHESSRQRPLITEYRPGFDERSYLSKQKPVQTAPVQQTKASLQTSLPEPTPTAVITVTDPASSGKSSPACSSPVGDLTSSSSAYSKTEPTVRCEECRRVFNAGQTAVVLNNLDKTSAGGQTGYWHPHCFRCHKCHCLLKDNKCYAVLGQIYCAEHFAEVNGLPKCTACNGWIFDEEFVWSKSHAYHKDHFLCCACAEPMEDEYILHNGRALCSSCFFTDQGRICRTCKSLIDPEEPLMENGLLAWHLNRSCFCCCICHQLLDKSNYESLGSRVFCDKNCKDVFVTQLALRHKAREMKAREAFTRAGGAVRGY